MVENKNIFTSPSEFRATVRTNEFCNQTSGQCLGYAQANLCILPQKHAFDFLLFCHRNPKPCPLLHVLEAGQYMLSDIDIRTDVPKYRMFHDGVLKEEIGDLK